MKLRLRTKFLLSTLLVSATLTCTSLLVVRRTVQEQFRRDILAGLHDSVSTFNSFQREREITLGRSADLLADMPILRALMTTQDEATIRDGSAPLWRLAGSPLFALAGPTGSVVALHTSSPGFTRDMAQRSLVSSLNEEGPVHWWYGAHHLYQVFLKPIYFGTEAEGHLLGFLIVGHEIDDTLSAQVSRIAASQVAFSYGSTIVRSTLTPSQEAELSRLRPIQTLFTSATLEETQLGDERFLIASLDLSPKSPPVRLTVLKSYDKATAFLDSLNRLLVGLGLLAVIGGSGLVFLVSHTFTRPLGSLVAGVRALEKGDFTYELDPRGGDEAAELTGAFMRMRESLQRTQQKLLETERLATIGRMASSISHDLRHSLAAIVANAEFLCDGKLSSDQREELYQEVRTAVNQMTELIDSLLEFSRTREALHPSYGNVKSAVERVVQSVRLHPEHQHVQIVVEQRGNSTGWFDQRKLERVVFNLVLNACEAVPRPNGQVHIGLQEVAGGMELRVTDNGRGVPEAVRGRLFEPFVSCGKENGTGLGLTVVQKIVQDHGGDVVLEKTSENGTVFKLFLPLGACVEQGPSGPIAERPAPALTTAKRDRLV